MDKALNKEILRLAIPSILANITIPLVGMVDIAVSGHLNGDAAAFIGGISVGSMLFDLLYWNFAFLNVGTGGLTAQAFGKKDPRECARIFTRGIGIALTMALTILVLQWPITRLAFIFIDSSPEVRDLALQYFALRVWAAPATISLKVFHGWFIGMQDTVSSMWTDLIVNAVNIAASILLALGFGNWPGLGFKGIALGTVIAQYSGLCYASLAVFFKYRQKVFKQMLPEDLKASFRGKEMRRSFSMNTDLFVRSLCFTGIYVGFTALSAHYGDMMLASCSIVMKLLMVFSYFTDGFAYAGQALTGRFIGEKSLVWTRKTVRHIFGWSLSLAVIFIFIYAFAGVPMLKMMSSDNAVVAACKEFLPWLVLMPPLGCAAFTWDGIYEGATASRQIRNAMLWAMAFFFVTWYLGTRIQALTAAAGKVTVSVHIMMGAYFAHLLARTVYLSSKYKQSILVDAFEQYQ